MVEEGTEVGWKGVQGSELNVLWVDGPPTRRLSMRVTVDCGRCFQENEAVENSVSLQCEMAIGDTELPGRR